MRCALQDLIRKEGKWINIFPGLETIDDPYEKNVITTPISPVPVKGLVVDLTATQAQWKMPGVKVSKAKIIYIDKKYRSLLENSCKIEIRNSDKEIEVYEGWRENGKMQYREQGRYLEVNIYSKHN